MPYESAASCAPVLVESKTTPAASDAAPGPAPRGEDWSARELSPAREYTGVLVAIAAVTAAGWLVPLSYEAFGHIYLFTVIALSLRVGRWPALFAAAVSAVAWDFVFVPPRLSFSILHFDDTLLLGTYFVVALIGSQLTARSRAQQREERQRERLAESERLHRTLLDSVSHELRTPLAVLRSAVEKIDTADAAKRASLLGEMRTAMHRLDHLVSNLLNQTRLEAGGLRPQPDWCDVRDMIGAARRTVGDALAGRPVKIEIPPEMPLFMADAPLMEHVLVNLLLNVALHTPAGSAVRLSTGVDRPRAQVFITVADSGPGLPAELREDLFQKFRRGRAARAGGLGLGLSIVRGFMLAQGGEVVAGTSPEGGASFTVSLPYSAHEPVPVDDR